MPSSDGEGSTVPNTPEDFSDVTIFKHDDAFAVLRPVNPSAQSALNASVNAIIMAVGGDSAFHHYRQFVHAERGQARASSVFTEDEHANVEEPDADLASQQWNGAFKFSLRKPPREGGSGWYLGTSRSPPLSPNQHVDILLAPPTSAWSQRGIAGIHARLYFHKESYRMVLQARHTVTVGKSERIIRNSQSQVLDDKDLVIIGDCTYAFEYTSYFQSVGFETELSQYVQQTCGPRWAINKLLSPTSVGAPRPLGEYYSSPSAFAQGTFGQVAAGWARDGAAVAIKHFKNPRRSNIESHRELMQIIGSHDNILRLLNCITDFQTRIPTVYCVYSPLAVMTLRDVISSYETNSAAKIVLLKDYIAGLSHLHDKGIMHRDIKLENLAVKSLHDPIGVILDLDAATIAQTSTDHMQGTIPYLAPEIIELKDWKPLHGLAPSPYEKSVDIWALGLSMFALMTSHYWSWRYFSIGAGNKSDRYSVTSYGLFRHRIEKLREDAQKPGHDNKPTDAILCELIFGMTEVVPEARLGASAIFRLAQSAAASIDMDISITGKQAGKHKIGDEQDTGDVKRQHLG
ncbi:MAG: hypothetical protein Q9187_006355 [Circinaria calcarea]